MAGMKKNNRVKSSSVEEASIEEDTLDRQKILQVRRLRRGCKYRYRKKERRSRRDEMQSLFSHIQE